MRHDLKSEQDNCHIRNSHMTHLDEWITNSHLTYESATNSNPEQHQIDDVTLIFMTWPISVIESRTDIQIRHDLISELRKLDNVTSTFVIWLISINGSRTDICPMNLPRTQTQSNTTSMMSRLYVVAFSMNFALVFTSIITTALNSIQPEDKLSQDRLQKVLFFGWVVSGGFVGGVLLSTISTISFCICLLRDGYD